MRIGFFCDAFLPENKAVAIRMYHLANGFVKSASSISIHTCTNASNSSSFSVKQNLLPAPSSESGAFRRLLAELLLGIETFFRILFSKYDLVLISSPPFFTSCLGAFAATVRSIPYVFDVRDEYPEVYFTAGLVKSEGFLGGILKRLEKCIYKNAFLIITVTDGIQQRIALKVGDNKVALVRNGFDDELFIPTDNKSGNFTIVFHGNIGKFQNPDLIIGLARLANERKLPIQFTVIGWGNNDESLKGSSLPNLTFHGMVEYDKIPKIISEAHLGVSFRTPDIISINSFPVKLYEYIGVGLPMIVTPLSEAGEFIQERKLGFQFSGENIEEILSKIEFLYRNSDELKGLSENVKAVRSQFSRQEISRSFATLLIAKLKEKYV